MLSEVFANVRRGLIAFFILLAIAPAVSAKSITDARHVEFTPFSDNKPIEPNTGAAPVSNYKINGYATAGSTVVSTATLGKRTSDVDGTMRRGDFVAPLSTGPTPAVVYDSIVTAVDTGGTASSAGSNPFAFGAACTYTISPTSSNLPSSLAASGTIAVTAGSGCNWTAASNVGWITIGVGSSGTGNGNVSYNVAANTTTSSRTGTLTVAGNTFTITQPGAPCSFTILPSSVNLSIAAATSGTVTVTTGAGCTWTASSNAAWITITAGATGNGSGTVSYNVAANTGTASRTGTVAIAGQTFTVNQAGAPCTFSISPLSVNLTSSAAATGTVAVTASAGCIWTATTNTGWLSVTGGANGTGNGTVTYTVGANTGAGSRTGTLTIAGSTFTVNQPGGPCTFAITPTSTNLASAAATTGTVTVNAGTGCNWTAVANDAWLTITSGSSGSGGGSVNYSVSVNGGTTPRTGTLTIGGQTFTVNQPAAPCSFTISPASSNLPTSAATTGTVSVTAGTGCSWTAFSNASSWLTLTAGANGSGNGMVSYAVAANAGTASRTGTVTIAGQTFTVNQAGAPCAFSISPSSVDLTSSAATTATVAVTASGGCTWTATTNTGWLSVTGGANGTGNGTVTYSVGANTGAGSRTGTLTIAGNTFTVNQAGAPCTFTLSPTLITAPPNGTSGTLTITTQATCAWTTSSNATWATVTGSGTGSGTANYTIQANNGISSRSAVISVGGVSIAVSQAAGSTTAPNAPTNLRIIK